MTERCKYYYSHFTEEKTEALRLRFLLQVTQVVSSIICQYSIVFSILQDYKQADNQ